MEKDSEGVVLLHHTFKYNKKGNLLFESENDWWRALKYNKQGEIIELSDSLGHWNQNIYHEPIRLENGKIYHWLKAKIKSTGESHFYDLYGRVVFRRTSKASSSYLSITDANQWYRITYFDEYMISVTETDNGNTTRQVYKNLPDLYEQLKPFYDYYMEFYTEDYPKPILKKHDIPTY